MSMQTTLNHAEQAATDILKNQLSPTLAFHNYDHTQRVVNGVYAIGLSSQLSQEDLDMVLLAAWFHDTGYRDAYEGHEEKSVLIAKEFLEKEGVSAGLQQQVIACIQATKKGHQPQNLTEQVLIDAGHFAMIEGYCKDLIESLRQELSAIRREEVIERDAAEEYLERILQFQFYTTFGQKVLLPARDKLREKLEKRINKLGKAMDEGLLNSLGVSSAQLKFMKKKLLKAEGIPERGIETMFRLTSKNHLTLSGMADSKANIMITINSLIISIILGSLMQKLDSNEHLIPPTIILLLVTLASLIFAILSLRPNVSDGKFTREDIDNQKTNLLFFW
jgi:predicted metal-dependent HD superfamily phosphohydrolase